MGYTQFLFEICPDEKFSGFRKDACSTLILKQGSHEPETKPFHRVGIMANSQL
jgi:hypothetical protein